MRKLLSLFLALMVFATSGCSIMDLSKSNSKDDHPYGYKTGKDYAEVWCGPCKQLDHFTVTEEDDGSRVEAYIMEDKEYGFTYQVEAYYTKVSSYEPQANYLSEDFDYQYLKVFLDETDFSKLVEKYELNIVLEEPQPANTEGLYMFYNPTINFYTDQQLSEDENAEIMQFTYDSLQDFDAKRKHFTRNDSCSSVFLHIYCKPSEKEAATGKVYGGASGRYGFKYNG